MQLVVDLNQFANPSANDMSISVRGTRRAGSRAGEPTLLISAAVSAAAATRRPGRRP
jgi:hypothetical protein